MRELPPSPRPGPRTRAAAILAVFTVLGAGLTPGCRPVDASSRPDAAEQPRVLVAAAASLGVVLESLAPLAERELGVRLILDPGPSGSLAQQIIRGLPADVFISANIRWMDRLHERGLLVDDTRGDVAGNALVLITSTDSVGTVTRLDDLSDRSGRIAIGEPTCVPAGMYAAQAFDAAGLGDALRDRFLPASDARAVLAYVAQGEAAFGVVYHSDARSSPRVRVLLELPDAGHEPIRYPAAVLRASREPEAARRVVAWLGGPTAQRVLRDAGFIPLQSGLMPAGPSP